MGRAGSGALGQSAAKAVVTLKIQREDILTPANAITVLGLLLTIFGSTRLNTLTGAFCIAAGRILDVFDGPVARHTHTSELGSFLDATADKFAGLALIIGGWYYHLIPVYVLLFFFILHLAISIINAVALIRGTMPRSSAEGKHTMFLQISSLVLFSFYHFSRLGIIIVLAYMVFLTSVPLGIKAAQGYYRTLRAA